MDFFHMMMVREINGNFKKEKNGLGSVNCFKS